MDQIKQERQSLMKTFLGILSFTLLSLFPSDPISKSGYKLIIFEGSDWCRNCRRLEKEVFSKKEWTNFLDQYGIEVEKIDFPQRKKQRKEVKRYNSEIAEKYNFEGVFPTLILVDMNSEKYFKFADYLNQTPQEIIDRLQNKMEALK